MASKREKVTPGSPKASRNCKSNENNSIYLFAAHPGIASWCHVHSQITKKTILESTLQLGSNYENTTRQNDSKVGPKGRPQSIKNLLKPVLANEREARLK